VVLAARLGVAWLLVLGVRAYATPRPRKSKPKVFANCEHGRLKTILEAGNFTTMSEAVTKYIQCSIEMTGNASSIFYTQRGNDYRGNNFRNNYRGRGNNRGNYQYNVYYQNNGYNHNNGYNRNYNNQTTEETTMAETPITTDTITTIQIQIQIQKKNNKKTNKDT